MRALAFAALLFCTAALADPPARAVPTFESLGLYWKPAADPGAAGCPVRFREAGEREWREGLPLWFDRRDGECRGSLVNLVPGTEYEIDLGDVTLKAKTWANEFPVAETVTLPRGVSKETLEIRKGGTAKGYVLYRAHPEGTTIDVEDAAPYNVVISTPFVILRGARLRGAQRDAIDVRASDVVIEGNDISEWGRYRSTNNAGWKIGVDMDSGIRANCLKGRKRVERVIIQRNRIHDPRYGANSWSWGHPAGPQAISFSDCGGNHVIRRNEITSTDPRRYFNDAIGGEDNFSALGFPNRDSDIHDNRIEGAWDDGIEAEGANMNVRIWGNAIARTAIGIATAATHHGPLYVFGNEHRGSRKYSEKPAEADDRGPMIKAGDGEKAGEKYGGGRRYIFGNRGYDVAHGISGSTRQPLTNTVSRNNEWKLFRRHWPAVREAGGSGNDIQDGRHVRIPNFDESARGDNR